MTDVSEADVAPQTNGFGDEDDRTKMRPADIDAVRNTLASVWYKIIYNTHVTKLMYSVSNYSLTFDLWFSFAS